MSRRAHATVTCLALIGLALTLASCTADSAEREYLVALEGEETDMGREGQIAHLDRAIRLAPDRARYYETRAIYEIDLGNFEAARQDLDRTIALAARPYVRYLRGLVLCQMGRFAESLQDFDAAIAEQPENSQFYRGRSLARVTLGLIEEGMADAEALVALAPQWAPSHYVHGVALAAAGRDEDAVAAFDLALAQQPELVYPLEARAASHERLGQVASALADRAEAADKARPGRGCGYCLDPYRY